MFYFAIKPGLKPRSLKNMDVKKFENFNTLKAMAIFVFIGENQNYNRAFCLSGRYFNFS